MPKRREPRKAPARPQPKMLFEYVERDPIAAVFHELAILFESKNAQYSRPGNVFANFDESAPVQQFLTNPLTYCMMLCAKQDDAFWKALVRATEKVPLAPDQSNERPNLRERLLDGAVYRIIALALLDRK